MRLRRQVTIVYLAASAEEQQLLTERYLNDPKPVLWRGAFQPKAGEKPLETVARCYAALLAAGVKAMKRWRIARSKLPPCGMDRWTPCRSWK